MANMFNEDGTYNKTEWKAGDKITAVKLNKIELSLEAINNNDISRHVETDGRLDILEERIANTPDNEQMDALEDMVKDNKDAADSRLDALNTGINNIKSNHLSISVLDFGAVGDGITDDTHSIQSAIDSIADGVNSTLIFPSGYTFLISEIIINKTHMNICGGGEILNGHIYINFNKITESYIRISNLTFRSTDRVGYGIMFNNTRRNTISDCYFINKNKALYVPPHVGNNINGSDSLFHSVGLLNINDNFFSNIDYCFYVDFNTDEVLDTSDLSKRWMRTNDIHFTTNYINVMKRCAVWCRGVDGIIITGNTIFSDSYKLKSKYKEQNIYIGKADWVVINTNNLFESGMEAIKIDACNRVNIVGNNIAWCGQRTPSSGISLGVYPNGIISNNIISKPTKYGIEITSGYTVVSNNLIEFDADGIPSTYYGDTDEIMSIDEHYSIYSGGYCVHNSNMSTSAMYIKNRNSKTMDNKTGLSYYTLEETFASGEIKPLLNLCDFSGVSKDTGGLLLIRVRLVHGGNAASYLVLFDSVSSRPGIIEIGKAGVAGTTSSTNWCNFIFSIEDYRLYATSNNSNGIYSFEITSLGNMGMGNL